MEEKRRPKHRPLHRICVPSRLEAQLWALAYQQLQRCAGPHAGPAPELATAHVRPALSSSSAIAQGG
jgi:hypothetical protein